MSSIKIIRPLNLFIVALTQCIIFYLVLSPNFQEYGLSLILNGFLAPLFILVTILITAGGYVINDIIDYEADLINKQQKVFIGRDGMTMKNAWLFYAIILIVGFSISAFIAHSLGNIKLSGIYIVAVALLYAYSKYFKQSYLIGNILIAAFTSGVFLIIIYAEKKSLVQLEMASPQKFKELIDLLLGFCLFSFLLNLVREIVKDLEDIEGDTLAGYKTMPIKSGVLLSKNIAITFSIILLALMVYFFSQLSVDWNILKWGILLCLTIFQIIGILSLFKAKSKQNFSALSNLYKIEMLFALVLIYIFS